MSSLPKKQNILSNNTNKRKDILMKASEYVEKFKELIELYGDLECVDSRDEPMPEPEEVEGVFVLADNA